MQWRAVVAQRDALGESPFWHPHEQMLYWIDIPGRALRRADAAGGAADSWTMPEEPGCIAPIEGGGIMIAMRGGIYRSAGWGGALERIARTDDDPRTTRFNDGKADPAGRFWAGTIYEPRDRRLAKLYSLDLRGGRPPAVEVKAGDAITANGLAWSPDARTMYWADTPGHVVHAFPWDVAANVLGEPRVLRQFGGKPPGWKPGDAGYGGRPDGAAVDAQGNYWCAMFEGARVLQLSPGGELLGEYPVPVRCPTMPCFGGPDLRTLFVTSASHGRPAQELREFPLSGRVIAAQVAVPGLPVNFVRP
ncbi:SMP-30/gluconolactonase/LRE family protein [Caenimonas aquaedulcis]|uniref:SMP-30/gluconolactonase/LRE family protein n=1 Tax=Caenimonas aquaedulcis TaxID=2793270 RepID=A0A931H5Y1_9BURK|nr:SMP-30/gluconolactonase/LRE family protein [Caenimonas aquaedulcis]MBG9389143.1 SMP-30/gluconolactonase/LRE family protein [Caenimonas aquaedulcis]